MYGVEKMCVLKPKTGRDPIPKTVRNMAIVLTEHYR